MKLRVEVFGEDLIERELLRFSAAVTSAQPAFEEMAEDMRKVIGEQFSTEGGRSGGWAPLKPETLAAKAAKGLDPHILQATHGLINSLTHTGGDHIEEIGDDHMVFGSRNPYGKYHQGGTSKMPARPPVAFNELDRRGFVRTLQGHLISGGRP